MTPVCSIPSVDQTWAELVNAVSGLFCTSLNFLDGKSTVAPRWSFRPRGVATEGYTYSTKYVRYGALPSEIVCTENLTPWKKLLPCNTKVGFLSHDPLHNFHVNILTLSVPKQNHLCSGSSGREIVLRTFTYSFMGNNKTVWVITVLKIFVQLTKFATISVFFLVATCPVSVYHQVGLATLFKAVKLYDASYHSLATHIRPVCQVSCSLFQQHQNLILCFLSNMFGAQKVPN